MNPISKQRWELWHRLQQNEAVAYRLAPEASCSITGRQDVDMWSRFMNLRPGSHTLDIGCGPLGIPAYLIGTKAIGIDPLDPIRTSGAMPFIKAIGEYLPFQAESFDNVILATSLDHALSPVDVFKEARRCLKPRGSLFIWASYPSNRLLKLAARMLGLLKHYRTLLSPNSTQPQPFWEWLNSTLERPAGAVDAYHVKHLNEAMLVSAYSQAGFVLARKELYQASTFVRLIVSPIVDVGFSK